MDAREWEYVCECLTAHVKCLQCRLCVNLHSRFVRQIAQCDRGSVENFMEKCLKKIISKI